MSRAMSASHTPRNPRRRGWRRWCATCQDAARQSSRDRRTTSRTSGATTPRHYRRSSAPRPPCCVSRHEGRDRLPSCAGCARHTRHRRPDSVSPQGRPPDRRARPAGPRCRRQASSGLRRWREPCRGCSLCVLPASSRASWGLPGGPFSGLAGSWDRHPPSRRSPSRHQPAGIDAPVSSRQRGRAGRGRG